MKQAHPAKLKPKVKYVPKPPQLAKAMKNQAAALQAQTQKVISEKKRRIKELAAIFINGKVSAALRSPQTKRFQKDGISLFGFLSLS